MGRIGENIRGRLAQTALIVTTVAASWYGMTALHESGHLWHGWLSGAKVKAIHLPVIGFSARTDFATNPHPLFVAWGGVIWGSLFALALLWLTKLRRIRCWYLAAWFAGFCLIANGAYLIGGTFSTGGGDDGGTILRYGGTRWQLLAFGLTATSFGLYLWNGLGPSFGLGASEGRVDRTAVGIVMATLFLLLIAMVCLSRGIWG